MNSTSIVSDRPGSLTWRSLIIDLDTSVIGSALDRNTDAAEKPSITGTTLISSVIVSVRFSSFQEIEIIGIIVEKGTLERVKKVERVLDY